MKITIVGRKCTPRDSFKERTELKLNKIEKFFTDEAEAKVTAKVEKNKKIVEITVKSKDMIFRAEQSAPDLIEALDKCVDKLIRQIRKNKTKVEKKLHTGSIDNFVNEEKLEEETNFDVVRTKSIDLKPVSVDEAILQMNMLDHVFYVFLNADTNTVNVVYRRNDGGYGLLQPNI